MNSRASVRHVARMLPVVLFPLLTAGLASADTIDLKAVAAASAVDDGPQDRVFDSISPSEWGGLVADNGWTSYRTAVEFDVSVVPAGSKISRATLFLAVGWVGEPRGIAAHGYAGDGSISLSDFSHDGFVDGVALTPFGSYWVPFDATSFVESLLSGGQPFAGFNLREDPATPSNPGIVFFGLALPGGEPRLTIDVESRVVPEPVTLSLFGTGLVGLAFARRRRVG